MESINSTTSTYGGDKKIQVNLPKFNLRSFSGRIHEWREFWDAFKSAIHQNDNLANVDKFNYLKGYLEDKARSVIFGIPKTDASHEIAVDLLMKRFGKPNVIQRAHVNQLIAISPVFNEINIIRLRSMHDKIKTHPCGLKALGVDMATYSGFVVPVRSTRNATPQVAKRDIIQSPFCGAPNWRLAA